MPSLIVVSSLRSAAYHPLKARTIEIGRSPKCDVQLVDDSVSRQHVRLQFSMDDQTYSVVDLGSSNGTTVNGERVSAPRVLRDGDEIAIGSARVRYTDEDFDSPDAALEHAMLEKWFGEEDRHTIVGG